MLCGDSPQTGLVGIAKLAADSEVLGAKRAVRYFEIGCRSVLNRTGPTALARSPNQPPFEWSINPYRGCEFGCRYCYARYTHEFMELRDSADFEDRIYAKSDVAEILRRELRRSNPTGGIAIGTATDPYQPAERRFKRTRAILEVAPKRKMIVPFLICVHLCSFVAQTGSQNQIADHYDPCCLLQSNCN